MERGNPMVWQYALVFATVAAAAAYLSWSAWRAWKKAQTGCGGGCGCAGGKKAGSLAAYETLIPMEQLVLRKQSAKSSRRDS